MIYSLSLKLERSSASLAIVTTDNSKKPDNWHCFGIVARLGVTCHYKNDFMVWHVVQSLVQGEYKTLMDHFCLLTWTRIDNKKNKNQKTNTKQWKIGLLLWIVFFNVCLAHKSLFWHLGRLYLRIDFCIRWTLSPFFFDMYIILIFHLSHSFSTFFPISCLNAFICNNADLLLVLIFLLCTLCKLKLLDYQTLTCGANLFLEIKQCRVCFLFSFHVAGVENF